VYHRVITEAILTQNSETNLAFNSTFLVGHGVHVQLRRKVSFNVMTFLTGLHIDRINRV
jgi:hypothetical protein